MTFLNLCAFSFWVTLSYGVICCAVLLQAGILQIFYPPPQEDTSVCAFLKGIPHSLTLCGPHIGVLMCGYQI